MSRAEQQKKKSRKRRALAIGGAVGGAVLAAVVYLMTVDIPVRLQPVEKPLNVTPQHVE